MRRWVRTLWPCLLITCAAETFAQVEEGDLRLYGYFQNEFEFQSDLENDEFNANSFGLQQLNVFLRKDLAPRWRSYVNFEVVNSYSSSRLWGAFNMEEAWGRYRLSKELSLKLGLQIPTFNHLNEIKNRTPLLPYVVRPLVYESSFNEEVLSIEEYSPSRAFVQAYGYIPYRDAKVEYAVFLGNSPNVRTTVDGGQSGLDTTTTILVGGRIGARFKDLKLGLSATHDRVNFFKKIYPVLGEPPSHLEEKSRVRLGGDLSYDDDRFRLDGEVIAVRYDDDVPELKFNKRFYYTTLGYYATEQLLAYVSYWYLEEHLGFVLLENGEPALAPETFDVKVPNLGIAYNPNDRVVLKLQYARGDIDNKSELALDREFDFYSGAISVFF